tara:strand:+ start:196 stop:465 length:270 start_codon:yes stop_codon:yes gene_type:complete
MSKKQKTNKPTRGPSEGKHGYLKAGTKHALRSDEYHGIGTAFDRGYITFCKKKKNALGKKCNRTHLLPTGYTFGNGKTKPIPSNPSFKN